MARHFTWCLTSHMARHPTCCLIYMRSLGICCQHTAKISYINKGNALHSRILDYDCLLHLQQLLETLYRRGRAKGRHSTPCFLKWRPNQYRGRHQRHWVLSTGNSQTKTPHRQKHFGGAAPKHVTLHVGIQLIPCSQRDLSGNPPAQFPLHSQPLKA